MLHKAVTLNRLNGCGPEVWRRAGDIQEPGHLLSEQFSSDGKRLHCDQSRLHKAGVSEASRNIKTAEVKKILAHQ